MPEADGAIANVGVEKVGQNATCPPVGGGTRGGSPPRHQPHPIGGAGQSRTPKLGLWLSAGLGNQLSRLSLATFTIAPPSRTGDRGLCVSFLPSLNALRLQALKMGTRPGPGMVTRIGFQLFLHLTCTCSPRNTVVAVLIRGSPGRIGVDDEAPSMEAIEDGPVSEAGGFWCSSACPDRTCRGIILVALTL